MQHGEHVADTRLVEPSAPCGAALRFPHFAAEQAIDPGWLTITRELPHVSVRVEHRSLLGPWSRRRSAPWLRNRRIRDRIVLTNRHADVPPQRSDLIRE